MPNEKYIIIGLGQFGMSLLESLLNEGLAGNIMVIDTNEEKIRLIQDRVQNAIILDATDSETLQQLEPETFDVAVVSMGEGFKTILFISVLLKELGVKKVIARASTQLEERILKKTGVDLVVFPEVEMGKKIANLLLKKHSGESLQLPGDSSIFTIKTPPDMVGKTLTECRLRKKYELNVIAVKTKTEKKIETIFPDSHYQLKADDMLILVGKKKVIDKFIQDTNPGIQDIVT
ncbi:MAG: TrkA family potassium uptake protein [Spirochaetales bacterium]|nr:TrkA family potassium uptake protein [Spirochaetales bacterium]